jgi:hydrogenase maturation factor
MCVSRLHRVLAPPESGSVLVEDMDGGSHLVSLLAFDGSPPRTGDWLVVHSGYALTREEPEEARAAWEMLHPRVPPAVPGRPTPAPGATEGGRSG